MLLTDVHDLLSGENIVAILIVQFKKHLAAAAFCEGLGVCARQVHISHYGTLGGSKSRILQMDACF